MIETSDARDAVAAPLTPRRKRRKRMPIAPIIGGTLAIAAIAGGGVYLARAPRPDPNALPIAEHPSLGDAAACAKGGDFNCAEANYRGYLMQNPNDVAVTTQMAMTLATDGKHLEAIKYYKRSIALGEHGYDIYANYATSLNLAGDLDEAIKMNYAALQDAPYLAKVRGELADQLVKKGRAKEAVAMLETYDRSKAALGDSPYFTAQINAIRKQLGEPPETPPTPVSAPRPFTPRPGKYVTKNGTVILTGAGEMIFVPRALTERRPMRPAVVADDGSSPSTADGGAN